MADPLSIATGVVAFIGAANALASTIKKLHRVRHAHTSIKALEDEMRALRDYVESIRQLLDAHGHLMMQQDPMEKHLNRAHAKVNEVNMTLLGLLKDSSHKTVRTSTWLHWDSQLSRMRQELRDVRVEIGNRLSVFNASAASRTSLQVETLAMEGRLMQDDNLRALALIQRCIIEQRPAIAMEIESQLAKLRDDLKSLDSGSSGARPYPPSPLRRLSEPPLRRRLALCDRSIGLSCQRRSSSDDAVFKMELAPTLQTSKSGLSTQENELGTVTQASNYDHAESCKTPCNCQCHRNTRLKSPDILQQLLGQVSIGYAGITYLTAPCNERSCSRHQKARVRVQYQFPMWSYVQGFLTLVSQSSGVRGPEKSLRLSRIRPGLDEVFIQVQNGNLPRLKQLFLEGRGSLFDASDTGWTLLHYATVAKQLEVIKFLKDAGADPHAEADRRETPFDVAWNRILSGSLDQESELHLREVFNDSHGLDHRQFTVLHKIVLGLIHKDLRAELDASTAMIDVVDGTGYTALAWASARGDLHATSLLLEYGASSSTTTDMHELPIHLASQTGSLQVAQALVDASANVNARVWQTHMTPLHFAAEYQNSAGMIQGLVAIGAQIEARDWKGWTPLHWASWRGHTKSLQALLDLGADPNEETDDGSSAVLLAVANNSHECLDRLIRSGSDCCVVRNSGWNLLHYAAVGGTSETLRCLNSGTLFGINIETAKTLDTEQTVQDMYEARMQGMLNEASGRHCEQRWETAWEDLMDNVRGLTPVLKICTIEGSDNEEEEDDLFADAVAFHDDNE
ncbi:ankyrin repeat-containing domain protein [Elsinoe ampelina]|uniref:Ankyrin repeat-containing domain protein n=1 Tax=Elsinoe ampelina TaxID=302913 RepID=A0A6A6GFR8_9PEZI|nr:ankyrin repeat-containing domain protein [Elsinoe ampelina]